jgi:hypothetical protein
MSPRIPENVPTWLAAFGLVTIMGDMLPPRDPNDDDEDEEEKSRRSLEKPEE